MTVVSVASDFEIGPILQALNLTSIGLFAATGALAAARKHQTLTTMAFFGLLAGLGGGTVRDIIINAPVFWIDQNHMALVVLGSALAVWFIPSHWWRDNILLWFDAVGLATYAVYGAARALEYSVDPMPAILMGTVTACAGGIIRDIILGEQSIILGKELYVTCAFVASAMFVLLDMAGLPTPLTATLASLSGFALRAAAIRFDWSLPSYSGDYASKRN